jgi:hypothetical protein
MTKTGKALAALAACAVIAAALLSPAFGAARGGGGHGSNYCTICARDIHGRIARSPEARQEFMTQTGYPRGRPGYDRRRQGQGRDGVTSRPDRDIHGR